MLKAIYVIHLFKKYCVLVLIRSWAIQQQQQPLAAQLLQRSCATSSGCQRRPPLQHGTRPRRLCQQHAAGRWSPGLHERRRFPRAGRTGLGSLCAAAGCAAAPPWKLGRAGCPAAAGTAPPPSAGAVLQQPAAAGRAAGAAEQQILPMHPASLRWHSAAAAAATATAALLPAVCIRLRANGRRPAVGGIAR